MSEQPDKMKCTLDKAFLPESCPNWRMGSECTYVGVCKFKKSERKPASQRVRELPTHKEDYVGGEVAYKTDIELLADELEREEKGQ